MHIDYLLPSFKKHIAIIANGLFPNSPEIITSLATSSVIIACDGAIHNLHSHALVADYVIGDGDSANVVDSNISKHPYIYLNDQNSNDLTKAFNFALANFQEPFIIYAASGLREDHSIANFALLAQYVTQKHQLAMISDYGIFTAHLPGTSSLTSYPGQQISFFTFNHNAKITCLELKWPLSEFSLAQLYSGTLNQATTDSIHIAATATLIIYRAFEIKTSAFEQENANF